MDGANEYSNRTMISAYLNAACWHAIVTIACSIGLLTGNHWITCQGASLPAREVTVSKLLIDFLAPEVYVPHLAIASCSSFSWLLTSCGPRRSCSCRSEEYTLARISCGMLSSAHDNRSARRGSALKGTHPS